MPIAKGETQVIRLDKVSTDLMRIAKARAAREGRSIQEVVTEILERALQELQD